MKKQFLLFFAVWAMIQLSQATTFYVSTSGVDTNNGLSWTTPFKTIGKAITTANAAGSGDIWVQAGTYVGGYSPSIPNVNFYGGFFGNETALSQRTLTDADGNGIVEPWEFANETILSYTNTLTTNAGPLFYIVGTNITSADKLIIDGFTMSYTNVTNSNNATSALNLASNAVITFQNNIIRNCSVNITSNGGFAVLMSARGIVKNCLFERNSATIAFASTVNNVSVPLINLNANTKMTGCIVRNNSLTVDYTGNTNGSSNFKGLMLQITGGTNGTPAQYTTVSNCLVHNNEATYLPTTGRFSGASMVGFGTFSSSATTDSLLNCVIANNKGTRLISGATGIAMAYAVTTNTAYHYVLNNVLWNNIDETAAVKNLVIPNTQGAGSISNNVMNGGMSYSTSLATVANNLTDLSTTNLGTNPPAFKNPTILMGITTDLTTEKSDWRILTNSYLIGKGIATTRLTDKAGNLFASSPAVGAYETVSTLTTGVNIPEMTANAVLVTRNGFVSNVQGSVQVLNFLGKTLKSENVKVGQEMALPAGGYILRIATNNGILVQKIVL